MNPKILIGIDSFHDGGAEMFAIRLANSLASSIEVHFLEFNTFVSKNKIQKKELSTWVSLFQPDRNWIARLLQFINTFLFFGKYKKVQNLQDLLRQFLIKRYCKRNQIKNFNSHAILLNNSLIKVKEQLKDLNLVLTLHGHYEFHYINNPEQTKELLQLHSKGFDKVIYTTQEQLNNFISNGLVFEKAKRIFYGFEVPDFQNDVIADRNDFNILLHSRAISQKGWNEAVEAVFLLREKGLNVSLTLIGMGDLVSPFRYKYVSNNFIEIPGYIENVFPYIKRSKLGLLPTYFEGESLPNSVIECLAMGKPVISTTVGAIEEMLNTPDGIAGDIIETVKGIPVDPKVLANLIEKYVVDLDYLNSKVKLSKLAFEKFNMEKCVKEYLSILA